MNRSALSAVMQNSQFMAGVCTRSDVPTLGAVNYTGASLLANGAYGTIYDIGHGKVAKLQRYNKSFQTEAKLNMLLGESGIGPKIHRAYISSTITVDGRAPQLLHRRAPPREGATPASLAVMEMDRYDGNLVQMFKSEPPVDITHLDLQLERLIDDMHALSLLCTDIKPQNALYRRLPGDAPAYEVRLSDFDTTFCCSRIDGCPTKLPGCQKNIAPALAKLASKLQLSMVTHAFARIMPDGRSRPLVLRAAALKFLEEGGGRSLNQLMDLLGGTDARRGPLSTLPHYHACAAGRGDWTVELYLLELGADAPGAPKAYSPPAGLAEALTCSYHTGSYF